VVRKITRDLKKQYRRLERYLRTLSIDLSDDSWYHHWHLHLDWDGFSHMEKHRRRHLWYYKQMLDKIEILTEGSRRAFQTYILVDGEDSIYDALFLHTSNPHSAFPLLLDGVDFSAPVPPVLEGLLDTCQYVVGRMEYRGSYIIQKKGLGLPMAQP